ncbi:MAG: SPFH domain-containing protein [Acidobacteria bacterium]|nr:SPFH domain-containing protein [Acidobacteriota bacterium]
MRTPAVLDGHTNNPSNFRALAIAGAVLVVFALAAAMAGCKSIAPDAGHEVVLVEKPMFVGHGGIDPEPVRTGRAFVAATTDGIDVNMQPVAFQQDLPDTMTADGVPVSFHAIMNIRVTDSVKLISQFGTNWYANNLDAPFMSLVRQQVRQHGMNEVAISASAIDSIDAEITKGLNAFIIAKKLPVELITLTIGRAIPPDAVKNQRIETATQEQRIQTEQQKKLAEDARSLSEQSRAKADNAYRQAMQLSPEQFIQLETVKMMERACGNGNCTFVPPGTSVMVGKH